MTSVRSRTAVVGGALALTAGLLVAKGSVLGDDLPKTALLGAALGAVLALVPDRSVVGRLGGFLGGVVAVWLGYALRADVLPATAAGRALAAVIVVALVTAVAVASAGRAPLWAGLLGAGTMIGAYETTFSTNPAAFLADSATAGTTVLVSAALALLVTTSLDLVLEGSTPATDARTTSARHDVAVPAPRASVDPEADAGLDITTSQETSR